MEIKQSTKQEILDRTFIEARVQLIDLAAFLDRIDRGQGEADFRLTALKEAIQLLAQDKPNKTEEVLMLLSDPSTEPIPKAEGKGASGAYDHWESHV